MRSCELWSEVRSKMYEVRFEAILTSYILPHTS